ncbi:cupin domain-containing protein [Denitrobaculum tricleocarpae]|nr:cupin domain-containing protein [Denitrobaculum tricleocarpae]
MSSSPATLVTLDALPPVAEFYAHYWNKRPFLVRDAIDQAVMGRLITPDELAGLSMEETVRARMVSREDWSCQFGPFGEEDFNTAGKPPWSLLVQNVEQFHPDTAALLRAFDFAPRWLMDDVMVSFSTRGGTIGGHVDSYHVFLVQGQGTRRWTVGREAVMDEVYIDGLELKILKDPIDGDCVEVTSGDVLYIPPHFAHEGSTLDDALTFSVGFLGPKLSELYGAYGQYLAEQEACDHRYVGAGLSAESAGFTLSINAVEVLRNHLAEPLSAPAFSEWLAAFFTGSSNEDIEEDSERDDALSQSAFTDALQAGTGLIKPAYVKFALIPSPRGRYSLGFNRKTFDIDEDALAVILSLMKEEAVTRNDTPALLDHPGLLRALYNQQALEFV